MAQSRQPLTYRAHGHQAAAGEDWSAVTAALNERMAELRVGQAELCRRSGVSVATLRALQRGTAGRRVQDPTLAAIGRGLDWPDDHLIRVLTGQAAPPVAEKADDVCARLRELEGTLADVVRRVAALEAAR